MTTREVRKKEKAQAKGTKEITFECRFCGRSKPLDEVMVLTRFFPLLVACQDCEKEIE